MTLSVYNNERVLLHDFSIAVLKSYGMSTISCQGLVCILSTTPALLCNPSTKDVIALPQPQEEDVPLYCRCVGFGFVASIQKFKVVKFLSRDTEDDEDEVLSCEVFTLGAGDSWIEARTPPPYWPCSDAPLLNWAIHLMPFRDSVDDPVDDHYIAAFDLDTENYRTVPLPEFYFGVARFLDRASEYIYLLELKGSLCLSFDRRETENRLLELWVLKDYTSGNWVKKYNIVLSLGVQNYSQNFWACPITIMSDGSILTFFDYGWETHLRYYNPKENCFEDTIGSSCWANLYVESLFNLGRFVHNGLNTALPPLGQLSLSSGADVKDLSHVDSN